MMTQKQAAGNAPTKLTSSLWHTVSKQSIKWAADLAWVFIGNQSPAVQA